MTFENEYAIIIKIRQVKKMTRNENGKLKEIIGLEETAKVVVGDSRFSILLITDYLARKD